MEDIKLGMCRCCASEGTFKDITGSYSWMGAEEVYGDMLKDCFDITLTSSSLIHNGGICEVCITQLRNAFNFKKQVISTEEQFKTIQENFMNGDIIKVEATIEHDSVGNSDAADEMMDDDFSSPEYDLPIKLVKKEKEENSKKRPVRSSASKAKKAIADTGGPSKRKKEKLPVKSDHRATPERIEHRVNLTTILRYSNASPFRDKTTRGYCCLYCGKFLPTIEELRAHTALPSEKKKIHGLRDYKLSYYPIKVDITDLTCNACERPMRDLHELKDHLVQVHHKIIHRHIKDIILPFRLGSGDKFVCVVCADAHVSFKNLYLHMSGHYRNYCCEQCGMGYITIAALRKHYRTHFQGNFPCDYCDKVYTSLTKKRNHEKGVHTKGWLRNKCPHCPEVFVNYYDRSDHVVKVHGGEPLIFSCKACNRIYKRKFDLTRHIRHHHMQQRGFTCDICDNKFFSRRGLVDHMSCHTGVQACECDVCGKKYARLRSLSAHMRLHQSDKRYQCDYCKKMCTHKYTLKKHMKLHQNDLDIFKEFDDVKHLIDDREMTLKEVAAESRKKATVEKTEPVTDAEC